VRDEKTSLEEKFEVGLISLFGSHPIPLLHTCTIEFSSKDHTTSKSNEEIARREFKCCEYFPK
jgi:hypothetical protein